MSRWPTIYVGQPDEPDVIADADEDPDDEDTGPASPDVVLLLGFDPDEDEPTENFDPAQPRDPDGRWSAGGGGGGSSADGDAIEEKIEEYSDKFEDEMFFAGKGAGRWFYPVIRSMVENDPRVGYRDVAKAVKAVKNYVSGSHALNSALRRTASIPSKHQAVLRGLGALEKSPPGKTLYRGLALPEDKCKALFQKGAVIRDRAILSTSESKKYAEGFTDTGKVGDIPVLMTLTSTRPSGRCIPKRLAESMWGNEREVVFPPRSKIKVSQARYNKSAGRYEVKGTIL